MDLELVSGPAEEVCDTNELKAQMRVEVSDDDELIDEMGRAARELCERFTRRAFMTQTWNLYLDRFPDQPPLRTLLYSDPHYGMARYTRARHHSNDIILIPKPPLQSVVFVKYYDANGVQQTLVANTDYQVMTAGVRGRVAPYPNKTWPTTQWDRLGAIQIQFKCGYGDTSDQVPRGLKQAIKLQAATFYAGRESFVVGASIAENPSVVVANLLRPYKALEF